MRSNVDIGPCEDLALKGAILLYQGRRGFASWHEAIKADNGALRLSEASPLTIDFVRVIVQSLGTQMPTELLPDNVLVRTADTIVWWTSSVQRTMFFRATDESIAPLNGKSFPHPPLVWKVSGHELWVRAMKKNARPTVDTPLCAAPYWNVNGEDGLTCQGSMRSPEDSGVTSIPQWERAFFQSEFTHATGIRPLTNHPRGFVGLWASLADSGKVFPTNRLVPAKHTLREFVQES